MLRWFRNKKARKAEAVHKEPKIIPRAEHGVSRDDIEDNALKVLYRLNKAGYQAHLVGGAVRDLLLGRHPKDFDVATDATPEEVNRLFRNCRLIGRRFRLAHVHFGRQIIEVATFRASHVDDKHQDDAGRILRDNVYGTLYDDVWRRDFTVNALYYNIADFSIIDYVDGVEDIHKKHLRLIGDQETRYREDPVRMLRAIRFAAKLDFSIDDSCREAFLEFGPLLLDIPSSRMFDEALKLFQSGHALESFDALKTYGLLQFLFPDLTVCLHDDPQVETFVCLAMQSTDDRIRQNLPVTPAFLFAALLWAPVHRQTQMNLDEGMQHSIALQKAANKLISAQCRLVAIPKRFSFVMRDIWALQPRFGYRSGRRAEAVLQHPKFRAGYDFLCLRAKSGENVEADCAWWTELQQVPEAEQKQAFSAKEKSKPRRRRRRKPRNAEGAASESEPADARGDTQADSQ
jgi:poly(A) polymerase